MPPSSLPTAPSVAGLDRQMSEALASYSEGFYPLSQEWEAQIPSPTGLRLD